jgi:glycosyltransferase involved in cell wall biosynthesis
VTQEEKVSGRFNVFSLSGVFRAPRRLTDVDCWHRHIPFAFAVVEILRPGLFVELGTHKGDSYCAFCQAVDESGLGTACYAVDSWEGDEQAGYYGSEVLEDLRAYHDPLYGRFSSLVKSLFDDALPYFEEGTVDLLHIDGCHTYEAVKRDFDAWLPKVSDRGIVLLHDTAVREREFGVWKLWEEIRRAGMPHFEFPFGNGLGVLAPGKRPDPAMTAFFEECRSNGASVVSFFHGLGENISLSRENGRAKKELERFAAATEDLSRALGEKDLALNQADGWLRDARKDLEELEGRLREADRMLWEFQDQAAGTRERIRTLEELAAAKEEQLLQADRWLREGQAEQERLRAVGEQLRAEGERLRAEGENLRVLAETKDRTLREIYSSKGWKWLTRYRRAKAVLSGRKAAPPSPQVEGFLPEEPFRACEVRILHPPETDRKRVVHAIANFMTGGSSRLVADLFEHLGHRYDQEVITFFAPDPPAYCGIPVHDFSRLEKPGDVAAFLRERRAVLVHLHYWGECDEGWYRLVLEGLRGLPVRVIENVNTPVAPLVDDVVDRYVYVSRYALEFTPPVRDRSLVIHPGSDLSLFSRNGAPVPDDVIGMVYRLEGDKLREDAVQVLLDVAGRRPATRVLVVGGGTFLEPWKKAAAEAGLADRVRFAGYVSYDRLPGYYRELSVFVAPVWKESFGQVSSFAMSMGIPVAGYRVGALEEILGSTECLGRDREELAEILVGLLDDREKRLRIGEENRKRVHELFSVEAMVEKYGALYGELLGTDEKEG